MIVLRYGDHFLRAAGKLPKPQQKKLASLLELIAENPFHPFIFSTLSTGKMSIVDIFNVLGLSPIKIHEEEG